MYDRSHHHDADGASRSHRKLFMAATAGQRAGFHVRSSFRGDYTTLTLAAAADHEQRQGYEELHFREIRREHGYNADVVRRDSLIA